jgi:hypothetical protein
VPPMAPIAPFERVAWSTNRSSDPWRSPDIRHRTSPLTARLDAHQSGGPASSGMLMFSWSASQSSDTPPRPDGHRHAGVEHGRQTLHQRTTLNPTEMPALHAVFVNALCSQ